jgi:transketolase
MAAPTPEAVDEATLKSLADYAYQIRRHALHMVARADSSHIGGALSMADILAVLYGAVLKVRPQEPLWPDRDRFVLSKGHCCSALYAALALKGFIPVSELDGYGQSGSRLMCHASHEVPGVEWSTGSLGHGLGLATGQALVGKRLHKPWRAVAVLSDGELDEGSNWEAILFAGHHKLDNLTVAVDANRIQSLGHTKDIIDLGSIAAKFRSCGWEAVEVDGHDVGALLRAFRSMKAHQPHVVVAHTIKGKGVSYMEDKLEWHYRAPKTEELLSLALQQLASHYGRTA